MIFFFGRSWDFGHMYSATFVGSGDPLTMFTCRLLLVLEVSTEFTLSNKKKIF